MTVYISISTNCSRLCTHLLVFTNGLETIIIIKCLPPLFWPESWQHLKVFHAENDIFIFYSFFMTYLFFQTSRYFTREPASHKVQDDQENLDVHCPAPGQPGVPGHLWSHHARQLHSSALWRSNGSTQVGDNPQVCLFTSSPTFSPMFSLIFQHRTMQEQYLPTSGAKEAPAIPGLVWHDPV